MAGEASQEMHYSLYSPVYVLFQFFKLGIAVDASNKTEVC